MRICRLLIAVVATLLLLLITTPTMSAEITFSADFESGSIGEVKRLPASGDMLRYVVRTRLDPKSPIESHEGRSSRWFYFMMCGTRGQTISLEIPGTDVRRPMYSYDNKHFERYDESEMPLHNGRFTKLYERDTVYVAYFTPYTTRRNEERIQRWAQSPYVRRFVAGHTSMGTPLEAIVVSEKPHDGLLPDGSHKLQPTAEDRAKHVVYIHGRVHPSETPSSWHLEAMVDRLLEGIEGEYEDILRSTTLYILPIVNPDGVRGGYSRTNPRGVNIESNYNSPIDESEAEAQSIKRLLGSLAAAGMQPDISLNMHSQSTPQISYWLHTAASTSWDYNRRIKLLAALTIDSNPFVRWRNMSYSTLKPHFIEGWMSQHFRGEYIALTFETPYSFYNRNSRAEWVNLSNLQQQARYSLNAIVDMLEIGRTDRIAVSEPRRGAGFRRSDDNRYLYFGESYLVAKRGGEELVYRRSVVPQGEYDLYRWIVVRGNPRGFEMGGGCWQYVERYSQLHDGEFEYRFVSNYRGERFDQIQLRRAIW